MCSEARRHFNNLASVPNTGQGHIFVGDNEHLCFAFIQTIFIHDSVYT